MRRQTRHVHSSKSGPVSESLLLIRAYDSDSNPSRPVRPSPLTASTIQGLPLELIDRLRSFPLFASAPDSFLGAIGKSLRPQLHQPHDYILTEGDDARSMYWLVRGSVRVTSRDGESTYAELRPGAFFGEIGILMDVPRTATIIAQSRSLVVRLNKEDLQKELPRYPQVERAIRDEASERLAILERKKRENAGPGPRPSGAASMRKRSYDLVLHDVEMGDVDDMAAALTNKRRKSPSPGLAEAAASSALGDSPLTVRQILKELPLFAELPSEILHFLGVNAQPCTFDPFTDIIRQGTQGRDVYFLVRGEVEVITETAGHVTSHIQLQRVRARLKPGQYFGEVTSLSLAPHRTATVRSVTAVECLRITAKVLDELLRRCSADLRQQVEAEARRRLHDADDVMTNREAASPRGNAAENDWKRTVPSVTFNDTAMDLVPAMDNVTSPEPLDPDPFFNPELDNMRAKSRRSSLAPPVSEGPLVSTRDQPSRQSSPPGGMTTRHLASSPLKPKSASSSQPSSPGLYPVVKPPPTLRRQPSRLGKGLLPDAILIMIFQHFDVAELMRLRAVSGHWLKILSTSADLMQTLDLSCHNRRVTDAALINSISPFVGPRPCHINLNNCFHVTDEGFNALVAACGANARTWKMRSVWDVTGQSILDLVSKTARLEEIDLSNCRKVGDHLLARIVGWVIPQTAPGPLHPMAATPLLKQPVQLQVQTQTPPGAVIGSPNLKRLTLSYCKHVQDRSMAHIAAHAAGRLEAIDLTRCTSVTDQGFRSWSVHEFPRLKRLVLADCTYLTDQAIVGVANAARNIRELDLVSLQQRTMRNLNMMRLEQVARR